MTPFECEFEEEVVAAVIQSRWPDRAGAPLRAHTAGCRICSDVAAAAGAIEQLRSEMGTPPHLPDSGRVWWVARMRARREAARTAGRPITVVQVLAFACAVGLTGACVGATSVWFQETLRWAVTKATLEMLVTHGVQIGAMAALLFVVPAAVYFVVRRD